MDISSLYSSMISQNAANTTSAASKAVNSKTDYSQATDDELMDACKSFESYFLEQCFKEMMKTVSIDESSSSATSTMLDYYKDEMVKEIAEQSTEKESLGLAQMLYEQMKRNYNL